MKKISRTTKRIIGVFVIVSAIFSMAGCVSWWQNWHVPNTMLQKRKLIESSLVLLQNKDNYIPIKRLSNSQKIVVSLGKERFEVFNEYINLYGEFGQIHFSNLNDSLKIAARFAQLADYEQVVVLAGKEPLSNFIQTQLEILSSNEEVSLVFFENKKALSQANFSDARSILYVPVLNATAQELAAQALCGGVAISGTLEEDISDTYKTGTGKQTSKTRLAYTIPEEIGIKRNNLRLVDTLIAEAMNLKAMPSCQVLIAKEGKVFYHKAFGFHTYDSLQKATTKDIYDLASVTKILGGTAALMKLYDQNRLELDSSLSFYLPYFKETNKDSLILRDILTHQARLRPFIDFGYTATNRHKNYPKDIFRTKKEDGFSISLTSNLYVKDKFYRENMLPKIASSKLNELKEYRYSDLGFILVPELVEEAVFMPFEELLQTQYYEPLGASTLTFNPLEKFSKNRIVPTERDSLFRKTLVWGKVHDEAAAMRGGISGHAGLFGNANDVAKMLQMYLNQGNYGETMFLKPTTLAEFTRCQFCEEENRRGLGFDKPMLEYSPNGNAARSASPMSYGHFGFTGTMIWVDPKHELIYVFLSNRVYPTRESKKLMQLNTRTRIQQVIYDAIER